MREEKMNLSNEDKQLLSEEDEPKKIYPVKCYHW